MEAWPTIFYEVKAGSCLLNMHHVRNDLHVAEYRAR